MGWLFDINVPEFKYKELLVYKGEANETVAPLTYIPRSDTPLVSKVEVEVPLKSV